MAEQTHASARMITPTQALHSTRSLCLNPYSLYDFSTPLCGSLYVFSIPHCGFSQHPFLGVCTFFSTPLCGILPSSTHTFSANSRFFSSKFSSLGFFASTQSLLRPLPLLSPIFNFPVLSFASFLINLISSFMKKRIAFPRSCRNATHNPERY